MKSLLQKLLAHPKARGLDPDAPGTTLARREIIAEKPFLKRLYEDWYGMLAAAVPEGPGRVAELGSGGGFLASAIPGLVTSEVFPLPGVSLLADARALPFRPGSLKALIMVDVFHHVPDCRRFLKSAAACVRPGGAILMIEPWSTPLSRIVYRRLHHEPFEPAAQNWAFPSTGPLSGANGALPWMVFRRDRADFARLFPEWEIAEIRPMTPFAYVLSGGVSMRSLLPGAAFPLVKGVERLLAPAMHHIALFAFIRLARTGR